MDQQQQRELEEGGGLFGASTASSLRASTSLGMGLGLAASGSLLRAPPRQEVRGVCRCWSNRIEWKL